MLETQAALPVFLPPDQKLTADKKKKNDVAQREA
jgi:hypothetical protein